MASSDSVNATVAISTYESMVALAIVAIPLDPPKEVEPLGEDDEPPPTNAMS